MKSYKEVIIRQMSIDELEKLRPAIEKAVKQKMDIINANHPPGYRESVLRAIADLKSGDQ